jgi:NADPH:quinone reductase-like Zn-dependent oxidoreductase
MGAWNDYTILNRDDFYIVPEYLKLEDSKLSCMYINPLTAYCFMDLIRQHNANCIIHTASSSAVGRIINRLCDHNNITIINTVRKCKYIQELKYKNSHTVSTDSDNYREELKDLCDKLKPPIAFECIGGETTGLVLNNLREEGCLYHYGNLSLRTLSNILTNDFIFQDKTIKGFWLFKYLKNNPTVVDKFIQDLRNNTGLYETQIQAIFKPEKFEDAFKIYRQNMSLGKVIFDFT